MDLDPPELIRANADSVSQTTLSTCLSSPGGAQVSTVEHLLSALSGMGIDNVLVECNAPELPIMDGKRLTFRFFDPVSRCARANAPREYIRITHIVEVEHEGKVARLEPFNGFRITFSIDFDTRLSIKANAKLSLILMKRHSSARLVVPEPSDLCVTLII